MSLDEVTALIPLTAQCLALQQAEVSEQWGQAYGYIARKAKWFAANGLYREALHVMSYIPGGMADAARMSEDPVTIARARALAQDWLRAVGWEGQDVLERKVRMAEEMVEEVAAMAAHLPSYEAAQTG